MKKILKPLIDIVIRFLILIFIIFIIFILLEWILKRSNQKKDNSKEKYMVEYYEKYNGKVNSINTFISKKGFWEYHLSDYTITQNNLSLSSKKKKILVVGDSFVWGWAQDNLNNLWWKQLEYMLKQKGYQDVEIIAAGMNGFSIVDETEKIILNKEYIHKIKPDLIIVGYVYNDFEIWDKNDPYFVNRIKENFKEQEYIRKNIDVGLLKKMNHFFPSIHNKIIQMLMNKEYAKTQFKNQYGYSYSEEKKQYLSDKYLKRIEKRAIEPLSKINIPVMVVNLAFGSEMYGKDPILFQEKVFQLLDQYHVENYDLKENYNKTFKGLDYKTELQVNIGDYHPGARVMNFYSQEIYNILKNKYPNIIGKTTTKFKNENFKVQYTLPQANITKINDNIYEISKIPDFLLEYPYTDQQYIKINLEYPTKIKKIRIHTKNIVQLSVAVDLYSEKLGYENKKNMKVKGTKINDNEYLFDFKNKSITSINISMGHFAQDEIITLEREK